MSLFLYLYKKQWGNALKRSLKRPASVFIFFLLASLYGAIIYLAWTKEIDQRPIFMIDDSTKIFLASSAFFAIPLLITLLRIFSPVLLFEKSDVETLFSAPLSPKAILSQKIYLQSAHIYAAFLILFLLFGRNFPIFNSLGETFSIHIPGVLFLVSAACGAFLIPLNTLSMRAALDLSLIKRRYYESHGNPINIVPIRALRSFDTLLVFILTGLGVITLSGSLYALGCYITHQAPILPLEKIILYIFLSVLVLLLATWFAKLRLMWNKAWVFEYGAVYEKVNKLQGHGRPVDGYQLAAIKAASNKNHKEKALLHHLHWAGAKAILWKELITLGRVHRKPLIVVAAVAFALPYLKFLGPNTSAIHTEGILRFSEADMLIFFFLLLLIYALTVQILATSTHEMLRKVEVEKPYPLKTNAWITYTALSKALPGALIALVGLISFIILNPIKLLPALILFVLGITIAFVFSTAFLLNLFFISATRNSKIQSLYGLGFLLLFLFTIGVAGGSYAYLNVNLALSSWVAGAGSLLSLWLTSYIMLLGAAFFYNRSEPEGKN